MRIKKLINNLYEIPGPTIKDNKIYIKKGSFIGRFWYNFFSVYPEVVRYFRAKEATKITIVSIILFKIMTCYILYRLIRG